MNKNSSANSSAQGGGVFSGKKILVVDDEPDALVFIATILEDNGAVALRAPDGGAALAMAKKERPDLITLDLAMPGMNGIDVFVALRSDPALRDIPVCIVTGRPEMRKLVYERPATVPPEGYVDKPVDEDTLVRNLRKIFEVTVRVRKQTSGPT